MRSRRLASTVTPGRTGPLGIPESSGITALPRDLAVLAVLFVNVPIGIAVALAALVALPGAARRPGRLDLPGAITGLSLIHI